MYDATRYPVNSYQQNFHLASQLDETHTKYLIPVRVSIQCVCDISKVLSALNQWIVQHPNIFSKLSFDQDVTFFTAENATIEQYEFNQEEERNRALLEYLQQPIKVNNDPLFRIGLFYLENASIELALLFHHILIDQQGLEELMKDLDLIFQGRDKSPAVRLNSSPNKEIEHSLFDFWYQSIHSYEAIRFKAPESKYSPSSDWRYDLTFTQELSDKITQFCKQEGATPAIFLNSCLAIVISSLQHSDKILLGTVTNARQEEDEGIGCFANTTFLPLDLSKATRFADVMEMVLEKTIDILEYGHYPFQALRKGMLEKGWGGENPFHIFTSFAEKSKNKLATFAWEVMSAGGSKFPLNVLFSKEHECFSVCITYDTTIFNRDYVAAVCQMIIAVAQKAVDTNGHLDITNRELYRKFAPLTTGTFQPDGTLLGRFRQHVTACGDRPFYVDHEQVLTWREVDTISNRVASSLLRLGVKPGDRVVFEAPRDYRFICLILGIWKIRGSFVCLDEQAILSRKISVFAEAKAALLLTLTDSHKLHEKSYPIEKILQHNGEEQLLTSNEIALAGDEAYMVFTSGTTGTPKGISISHSNVIHYGESIAIELERLALTKDEAPLAFAVASTLSADLGYTSVFASLYMGGSLSIAPYHISLDPLLFSQFIRDNQIDVLKITPSHVWGLSQGEGIASTFPLKCLILGGEKLSGQQLDVVQQSGIKVLNHYGPSETTVGAVLHHPKSADVRLPSVPIGKPLGLNQVLIVDHNKRLLPDGVMGELAISGPGVSRGYQGSHENTAGFEQSPLTGQTYYTGDFAYYNSDGDLVFECRKDKQIKILGHRVELHEIEHAVAMHINPAEFRVRFIAGRITLFCTSLTFDRWQQLSVLLRDTLTDYMIPTEFVKLERLPTTLNGKIDEEALKQFARNVFTHNAFTQIKQHPLSLSQIDQRILNIWEKHIGLAKSLEDSIYASGASSISAVRLIAEINEQFSLSLKVSDFLKQPRIVFFQNIQLGQPIQSKEAERNQQGERSYSLSSLQQTMWNINQLDETDTSYHVPILVRLKNDKSKNDIETCLNDIAGKFEIFRTRLFDDGENVSAIVMPEIKISIQQARFKGDLSEITRLCRVNINLSKQLPYIFFKDDDYLLIVIHHIITDAWSNELLLNAINTALAGNLDEIDILPECFVGDKNSTDNQIQYWLDRLKNKGLDFNLVEQSHVIKSGVVSEADIYIEQPLAELIGEFFKKMEISHYAGFLSIYNLMMCHHFNRDEILHYIPISKRKTKINFCQFGMAVDTLPVLGQVSPELPVLDYLKLFNGDFLKSIENSDVDFKRIVDECHLVRKDGRLKSNHMFIYEQESTKNFEHIERLSLDSIETKFELTFSVMLMQDGRLKINATSNTVQADLLKVLLAKYNRISAVITESGNIKLRNLLLHVEGKILAGNNVPENRLGLPNNIGKSLQHSFEEHKLRIGVIDGEHHYTYQELYAASAKIADFIIKKHLINQPVMVHMDRSFYAIAAIIGVILSGNIFVPVDGSSPLDRVSGIQSVIGENILILNKETLKDVISQNNRDILSFRESLAEDILYMIFTSGSTGVPKGVPISHKSLINYLAWAKNKYKITFSSTVPLFTSLSYDLTLTSIFLPLISGGKIHIIEGDNGLSIIKNLVESKTYYDMIKLTPTHLTMMSHLLDGNKIKAGCVVVGGEQLYYEMLNCIESNTPVYNEYGPTEATVGCCVHKVFPEKDKYGVVPIGLPIWNTRLAIIGTMNQVLSAEVVGELVISGVQLFSGYFASSSDKLHQMTLGDCHDTWYRSGDSCYIKEGVIHYVGREDRQYKIDGNRVDLGDIESAIMRVNGIHSAQVYYLNNNEPCLIAVISAEIGIERNHIVSELKRYLPGAMIPQKVIFDTEITFTDSGKIDFNAVLSTQQNHSPVKETRKNVSLVREIWETLLGYTGIDGNMNFFEAGGSSRKLLQLSQRLSEALNRELRPVDLLTYTTIYQQEDFLSGKQHSTEIFVTNRAKSRGVNQANTILNKRKKRGRVLES
ncbi:AMP-binding protein [Photorhabdus australis]|uniref:AMP-binding protein n=1 Tax=Photorhabdus australis TaxID=286156 RepID=UPI000B0BA553|nr:AMP-binding protein [Photorhabdus australis]